MTTPDVREASTEPVNATDPDNGGQQNTTPADGDIFEDLTVAAMLGQLTRRPASTWNRLVQVAQKSRHDKRAVGQAGTPPTPRTKPTPAAPTRAPAEGVAPLVDTASVVVQPLVEPAPTLTEPTVAPAAPQTQEASETQQPISAVREVVVLGLRLLAFAVAVIGNSILASVDVQFRNEASGLNQGLPFLVLAFIIWLGAEVVLSWKDIDRWYEAEGQRAAARRAERKRRQEAAQGSTFQESDPAEDTDTVRDFFASLFDTDNVQIFWRLSLFFVGLLLSGLTWQFTANNRFTPFGTFAWLASIILWVLAFAPPQWHQRDWWQQLRPRRPRISRETVVTLLALAAIVVLAGLFRFREFSAVPPEMTSDHVEKILDSYRVSRGDTNVFFSNNGGREPAQMYFMAVLASLPGLGMNFDTLKLLSVIEGLISIPLLWWLGREIAGRDNRRLGTILGLVLAALVAASYWHTSLSRLSLRIILTVIVSTVLLIYLTRAIRHNQRGDYIRAGLALGFGLYAYQAVRMLPIVVVVGIALGVLFVAQTWQQRREYAFNLIVLVLISFVVFVPLARFWSESPEEFWRRTSGRLFGDDIVTEEAEDGTITRRDATVGERIEAFVGNLPALANNIRNAVLMYNWKGDVAWINGAPNYPTMSIVTGALLIVGLAAWLARMIRRRDTVYLLVPLMVFIMLLPSAFSIAYPIENPSATRTSGSLAPIYLIAALPLALLVWSIMRLLRGAFGLLLATILVVLIALGSYSHNANIYFNQFVSTYSVSSLPYTEAGSVLRDFGEDGGGFGNAFMIGFSYWWDHRALAIEAGQIEWLNGIDTNRSSIPDYLRTAAERTGPYRFNPEEDLLFLYADSDTDTQASLQSWFPFGFWQRHQSYQPEDFYRTYYVPALGNEAFERFIDEHVPRDDEDSADEDADTAQE